MKRRIIINVLLLNVLALPCLLMFNDVDSVTGDWNYGINLFWPCVFVLVLSQCLEKGVQDIDLSGGSVSHIIRLI